MQPRLITVAPGVLAQNMACISKIETVMRAHSDALNKAINHTTQQLKVVADNMRPWQFLVEQYQKSPLAKKRRAKLNLTHACNAALAMSRRTLREIGALFTKHTTTTDCLQLRELLDEQQQANAPNYCAPKIICQSAPTIKNERRPTTI